MRKTRLVFLIGILVSFGLSSLSAQTLGDYQTNANSSWATVATWQVHNGTSFVALNNVAAGAYQNVEELQQNLNLEKEIRLIQDAYQKALSRTEQEIFSDRLLFNTQVQKVAQRFQ